jgi:hypothetical protein
MTDDEEYNPYRKSIIERNGKYYSTCGPGCFSKETLDFSVLRRNRRTREPEMQVPGSAEMRQGKLDLIEANSRLHEGRFYNDVVLRDSDGTHVTVKGLVDSGSQVSLIDRDLVRELGIQEDDGDTIEVRDLSGDSVRASACQIDVHYRGHEGPVKFYLMRHLKVRISARVLIGANMIKLDPMLVVALMRDEVDKKPWKSSSG